MDCTACARTSPINVVYVAEARNAEYLCGGHGTMCLKEMSSRNLARIGLGAKDRHASSGLSSYDSLHDQVCGAHPLSSLWKCDTSRLGASHSIIPAVRGVGWLHVLSTHVSTFLCRMDGPAAQDPVERESSSTCVFFVRGST